MPLRGQINRAIAISVKLCLHPFHSPVGSTCPGEQVPKLAPTVRATNKPPAMAPKRPSSKAAPSIDEAAKAALLAEKKGKALADNTPKKPVKTTNPLPKAPYAPVAPEDNHKHHPRLRSTRGQRRNRGRRSHQLLSRRTATTTSPTHQEPQPPKAERHPRGQAPTCHRASQGAPDDTRQGAESPGTRARDCAHVERRPAQSAARPTPPIACASR
jgi:hypothetical protein